MDAGAGGQPAEWQMQDLQYATPQQLLDMQQNNRASFERNIKEVLENAWEYVRTGHLRPSDLKLPMQLAPYPTHVTPLTGYEGGEYHPKKLGVGSTVVPPSEGRGSDTKGGWRVRCVSSLQPCPTASLPSSICEHPMTFWSLRSVRSLPSLLRRIPASQHFSLVKHALVCA
jgi:hypothetical protein